MLKPRDVGRADRAALIAAGGIALSAAIWVLYGIIDGLLLGGLSPGISVFAPEPAAVSGRLLAIVIVLVGTLLVQVMYARRVDAEEELELERLRVREMYENSPDRIACLAEDGSVLYTNLHAEDGHAQQAVPEVPCYELLYSRTDACADCALDTAKAGGVEAHTQSEVSDDGTLHWYDKTLYPITREDGTTDSVVEVARDVTELHDAEAALQKSHEQLEERIAARTTELTESNRHLIEEIAAREQIAQELRDSETRFRQLIDGSADMIILHSEGLIDLVNPAGVRMLGARSAQDVVGMAFASLWEDSPMHRPQSAGGTASSTASADAAHGVWLRRLDGSHLDVEMSETLVLLEGRIHVQCVIHDITEAIRAREVINRMAYFDSLTGLPNRELFADRLQAALAGVRRNEMLLAVAFIDVDEFRRVNEAWGHDVGDTVLNLFGERLQSLFRENDTVARRGSDEFAVVAELKSADEATLFAQRILAGLEPPFTVDDRPITLSVSLGVATTAGHGVRPEEIVQRADEAMRMARQSGAGRFKIACLDAEQSVLPGLG